MRYGIPYKGCKSKYADKFILRRNIMGLKQLPKCKESDCRFNHDCKYCTILTEKPKGGCRFKKERIEDIARKNQ